MLSPERQTALGESRAVQSARGPDSYLRTAGGVQATFPETRSTRPGRKEGAARGGTCAAAKGISGIQRTNRRPLAQTVGRRPGSDAAPQTGTGCSASQNQDSPGEPNSATSDA